MKKDTWKLWEEMSILDSFLGREDMFHKYVVFFGTTAGLEDTMKAISKQ